MINQHEYVLVADRGTYSVPGEEPDTNLHELLKALYRDGRKVLGFERRGSRWNVKLMAPR
jgi:hypothetical protein